MDIELEMSDDADMVLQYCFTGYKGGKMLMSVFHKDCLSDVDAIHALEEGDTVQATITMGGADA